MPLATTQQCAAAWNVSPSYARRLLASLEAVDRDLETGALLYDKTEPEEARNNRPGRGHRTDLASGEALSSAQELAAFTSNENIPAHLRALALLLWENELRLDDALALNVEDVTVDRREQELPEATKGRRRTVPLSEQAATLLREVMGEREHGPVFALPSGRRPGRETIAAQLRQSTQ
ncbi:tyrosine-type recombinase/integrase [Streptomyces sp. XD-27]|uniref:tyrosine-type recombinase/integrase n=1 Tax=Streptomyces sp. XD-27 TaxID=3062779 RepID=UPI0026F44EB8|nr:tyrosine-type recombinase/integrase [Streptomyces sp. XD-27]WKX69409.1 tyrosine-type recombinase/integrase [Streptomyces sp. XD-27]